MFGRILVSYFFILIGIGCQAVSDDPEPEEVRADSSSADSILASSSLRPTSLSEWSQRLRGDLEVLSFIIDSAETVLAEDPGSTFADSAFLLFRDSYHTQVRTTTAQFNDSIFQLAIWPRGFEGVRDRRHRGLDPFSAPANEVALSDSLFGFLEDQGVWPIRAEGDTYLHGDETTLLRELGPFLSDGMLGYQTLVVLEQTNPTGADASIAIPWDSIGARLSSTERLLRIHPQHVARDRIEARRLFYLRAFLAGWDNTPAFEWDSEVLKPEVKEALEWFATDHPHSDAGKLVNEYLLLLRQHDFRESPEVRTFLRSKLPH